MNDQQARKFKLQDSVVAVELDNEAVLLNVDDGTYYGLDEVGSVIWTLINQGLDERAMIDQLMNEFDASLPQIEADLAAFLGLLLEKNLVQRWDE